MKVISIGSDRNLFVEGSAVRERVVEYGKLCEELHVIVFITYADFAHLKPIIREDEPATRPKDWHRTVRRASIKISDNVWLYATKSRNRWFYVSDAKRIGRNIIRYCGFAGNDLLITCQDPFEAGLVGYFLKRRFDLPLQLQVHTDFLSPFYRRESYLNKLRVFIALFLIPRADGIRVVSERIKRSLESRIKNRKLRITTLPIFIEKEHYINDLAFSIDLHKKYPRFNFIIFMVARLAREKNIKLAINAMRKIVERYPGVCLVIAGSGSERKNFESQIIEQHLQENVVLEGGVSASVLAAYYHTADAFLLTSNYEGYGIVLIEAALSGLPVVTTNVGIAGDVLKDGVNSFICRVGDAACIVARMTELIDDETLRKKISERGRQDAAKTLVTKEEYLRLYKESWKQFLY